MNRSNSFWLLMVLVFAPALTHAQDGKVFRSKYGYTATVPDCWTIKIDDVDEVRLPLEEATALAMTPWIDCSKKDRFSMDRVVSIEVSLKPVKRQQLKKDYQAHVTEGARNVGSESWIFFAIISNKARDGYVQASSFPGMIRITKLLYCKDRWLKVTGPAFQDPKPEEIARIKKLGMDAMPEPDRSLMKSVDCIPW